jgi:hypothetical protein
MAKTKIEIELDFKGQQSVSQVEEKTKSLKAQLKEMKALLASGTLDNNQFQKLSLEAGRLQDRIGDVNQRVKNLASDSRRLDTVISAAQGIVGGFTAVQGITALVGTENENLQKTLVKLQGAMAALNGIQAVAATLNKNNALITNLSTIKTTAQGIANRFLTATTMESVAATYALRAALIATGIGAFVVLLGVAASAMSKFTDSTKSQKSATDELAESTKELNDAIDNEAASVSRADKLLIAQSKSRGDALSSQIMLEKLALQNQQHYVFEQLKNIVALRDSYAENTENYKKYEAERVAQAEKNMNLLTDIKLKQLDYDTQIEKEAEDERKKRDEKNKKRREEADKIRQKIKEQDERDAILEMELEEYKYDTIANVRAIDAERISKESNDRLFEIGAYNDAVAKAEFDLVEAKRAALETGFNIAQQFAGKNKTLADVLFAVQKGVAIAQIIIDTQKEIAGYASNPTWSLAPDGGASVKIPAIAAAKIRAATSIATIAATTVGKFMNGGSAPSSGGGSASSGGVGSMGSAPNTSRFVPTTTSGGQSSQRVYVLEKDITDSQGRVAKIRHNATLI